VVEEQPDRQRTGADGKPVYVPVLEWANRDLADRFSATVIALLRQAHPDDLAD
jgi:hypothetical protein